MSVDHAGREYREFTVNRDGEEYIWREYKLNPVVASLVRDLRIAGSTWRAIAIAVIGSECQYTGKDLCRLAAWTLGENENAWDEEKEDQK